MSAIHHHRHLLPSASVSASSSTSKSTSKSTSTSARQAAIQDQVQKQRQEEHEQKQIHCCNEEDRQPASSSCSLNNDDESNTHSTSALLSPCTGIVPSNNVDFVDSDSISESASYAATPFATTASGAHFFNGNSDHNKDHHHQSASDPKLSPPPPYERTTNVSSIRGGLDKSLGEAAARSPAESRGREAGETQEPREFNPHITLDATSFAPGYYYYSGRWMQDINRPSCNIPCFQSHDGALICGVCTVVFLVLCAIIGFLMFLLSRCGIAPGA